MKIPPRVLAVIANRDLLSKIDPIFRRRSFEVHHVPSGASALVVAGNVHYDVIVLESPLLDLELRHFLAALGSIDSTSDGTSLLILGSEPEPAATGSSGPPIQFLPTDSEPLKIHRALSDLLGVAARRTSRLLVQIDVSLEGGSCLRVLPSQNLSQSGILLRGGLQLEVGEKVSFKFSLPGDKAAIEGDARVVRHTGKHEATVGTAIEFLQIAQEHRERIAEFVHIGLSEPLETRAAAGAS